jgi:uncharacterized protein YdbL (DUF1318 family)
MKIRVFLAAFLLIFVGVSIAYAQDSKEGIKTRMKERYPQLKELKEQGKVGETHLGWVEVVEAKYGKDDAIKEIIAEENADREILYTMIAKNTEATPEEVGKQNAFRIFKKAKQEEYFKGKDGKWRQKKDVKTEVKKD